MGAVVEVRFKGNRKAYFTWDAEPEPSVGQPVVVEVERGQDLGHISAVGDVAAKKCSVGCDGCAAGETPEPTGRVTRTASSEEARLGDELRKAEEDVRRKVIERVHAHGLDMKVSDAEWQWDRKKLTVYFTADKRVDFRALVRDLASLFRTRIELRQIGARDEAKRLSGVGRCGREYCCSSWLPELRPVSLSLAKDQRLSLNPSQISGGCGRLLCCLRYEHDFYVTSRKRFPKEGKIVNTIHGPERVQAVDIFRERILLRAEDGSTRTTTLAQLKDESVPASAAPAPPTAPATLVTFDEGSATVSKEQAVDAVSPKPGRKRRRRGRRGRGRRGDGSDGDTPEGSSRGA